MTTLVRLDNLSGFKWVDFDQDQGARWRETLTFRVGDENSAPVNVSGYTARFVVIRAGFETAPVLDLMSPADITVGDLLGTFTWDVSASVMADLTHPVYQHVLIVTPSGNPALAFPLIKGRVLVRANVAPPGVPPVQGVGFGHGPWGHSPWGH